MTRVRVSCDSDWFVSPLTARRVAMEHAPLFVTHIREQAQLPSASSPKGRRKQAPAKANEFCGGTTRHPAEAAEILT